MGAAPSTVFMGKPFPWTNWARQLFTGPAMSNPTLRDAGGPTWRRWKVQCSARFSNAATLSPRKRLGCKIGW